MAFNIASLSVRLLAETRGYVSGLRQAEGRLRKFEGVARTVGRRTGLAAVIGGAAGVFSVKQRALALQDLSRQTGKSIEDLDALAFAAAQQRVPFQTFETTIRRLNRRASEAARGNKGLAQTFAQLGINAAAFVRLDAVDQIRVLSERLRQNSGRVEIFSEFFSLLDTEGQRVLQILTLSREQLEGLIAFARRTQAPIRTIATETERLEQRARELARTAEGGLSGAAVRLAEKLGLVEAKQTAVNSTLRIQELLNKTAISDAERLALIEGERADIGQGRVVNRALEFLGGSRRGGGESREVRDPQLKDTNRKLDTLIGIFRNNATGQTVTFRG